jgi:hypothetical protein
LITNSAGVAPRGDYLSNLQIGKSIAAERGSYIGITPPVTINGGKFVYNSFKTTGKGLKDRR